MRAKHEYPPNIDSVLLQIKDYAVEHQLTPKELSDIFDAGMLAAHIFTDKLNFVDASSLPGKTIGCVATG